MTSSLNPSPKHSRRRLSGGAVHESATQQIQHDDFHKIADKPSGVRGPAVRSASRHDDRSLDPVENGTSCLSLQLKLYPTFKLTISGNFRVSISGAQGCPVVVLEDGRDQDPDAFARFFETCIAPDPDGRVQSSEMHQLFVAWANAHGVSTRSNKDMASALKERGFRATKSSVMYWLGVKLTHSIEEFAHRTDSTPKKVKTAP